MRVLLGLVLFFTVSAPAQAAWLEATTKHFRIYSEGKAEALKQFATKVERFDAMLRKRFAVPDEDVPQRLTIFMLRSNEAVARVADRGKGVAGFYEPHASGSLAIAHREPGNSKFALDADTVLFHEYAHHFMLKHFPVAYPAWFVEGFAEFISTTDFTPQGHAQIGKPPYYRGYGLLDQAAIPVARLLTTGVADYEESRIDSFYGRSWLLTHFLAYERGREGQMSAYLKALNGGATSADAAAKAFGDLATLDKDLKAYLARRKITFSQQVQPTPVPYDATIKTLDAAQSALVMHRLTMMREPHREDAEALVPVLQKLVADMPSADGHRLLAEAQFAAEQYEAANASADAALKLDPALSRAMLVKANVAMQRYAAADTATATLAKEMRSWVVKANRADVNDPLPLLAFHRLFQLQGETPSQVARDGLRRAYEMVPEAIEVRMAYASSLANQKKWDEAIRLVETVAFSPHQGGNADNARLFLDRLKKAKAGDTDAVESLL